MGKLKKIHVNQWNIKKNDKEPELGLPVFTVKTYNSNDYGHKVIIEGASILQYKPEEPLPCGAKAWLETRDPVTIIDTKKKTKKEIV